MEKNRKWIGIGLSLLSGFLLWGAWPPYHTSFIIFIAFIPFFFALDGVYAQAKKPGPKTLLYAYLAFVAWNALTTWWIWFASPAGALMAILLNALLMALAVWLAYRVRRLSNSRVLWYASLIIFWICLEHIHFNWDAPWPWLALGNVFASAPYLVQWYEYTGVQGGTLWVFAINILIYESVRNLGYNFLAEKIRRPKKALALISIGVAVSVVLYAISTFILFGQAFEQISIPKVPSDAGPRHANVVVVQPNIDPYNDKFDPNTLSSQVQILIRLSEQKIDENTKLVVWPETAIAENIYEHQLLFYPSIQAVKQFLLRHPQVKLITGISSASIYDLNQKRSATARLFGDKSAYFDVFNSALLLDTGDRFEVYHKFKLVPGVEKMPYPAIFSFLEPLAIDLGGSSGSLGSQDSASVFRIDSNIIAAPVICYESIFGDYVGDYINRGANIITVITNDGWWDNSDGYRQHQDYAVLRAIETRRFIARSANTGISCFITPDGKVTQETSWWEPGVIKSDIILNNELTFYVRHGDYIAYILKYAGFAFLFYALFGGLIRRFVPGRDKAA